MAHQDALPDALELLPEAASLVQHQADERLSATYVWGALGDVRPDAEEAVQLHHREPSAADAEKLAGQVLDVPELADRQPLDAAVHRQLAQPALDARALDTQDAARSAEQSCAAVAAGQR